MNLLKNYKYKNRNVFKKRGKIFLKDLLKRRPFQKLLPKRFYRDREEKKQEKVQ